MRRAPVPNRLTPKHPWGRRTAMLAATAVVAALAPVLATPATVAAPGPVGSGFTVTANRRSGV